mgnify:CR=1 FL=1
MLTPAEGFGGAGPLAQYGISTSTSATASRTHIFFETLPSAVLAFSKFAFIFSCLMMEGYPKQGFSYESYYSHVSTLSTEAERKQAYLNSIQDGVGTVVKKNGNARSHKHQRHGNQAYLNSIQDRLGAIIEELEGVSSAVVTLTQSSGTFRFSAP